MQLWMRCFFMDDTRIQKALEQVQDLDGLAAHLEVFLNNYHVFKEQNGDIILLLGRALVEQINGLKIHIYAKEHAPPHFHVLSANIDAAFSIEDCSLIKGAVDRKTHDLIVYWHRSGRTKLIDIWNRMR